MKAFKNFILIFFVRDQWTPKGPAKDIWRNNFKDYHQTDLGAGLLILSRNKILKTISKGGDKDLRHIAVRLDIDGKPWNVLLVDIMHAPWHSRKGAFTKISKLIDQLNDLPLVILGDFNTPLDSAYIEIIRNKNMKEVFENVGQDWQISWSTSKPVLCIDQLWVNNKIEPRTAIFEWTSVSDHLPLTVTVEPKKEAK